MKSELELAKIKKIKDALIKKAIGYYAEETIEEYQIEDGNEVLVKKKITKKYVPADLSATKMLLDYFGQEGSQDYSNFSDDELDKEAVKLFKEYQSMTNVDLAKEIKGEVTNDNCGNGT